MASKTPKELMAHLLAGGSLINNHSGLLIHLNEAGDLINQDNTTRPGFVFTQWAVYTPPQWYDSIPDEGILCWVHAEEPDLTCSVETIHSYNAGSPTPYASRYNVSWKYATPVTLEFFNNHSLKEA